MSQVKNLRAMFETKGDDSSPPDRGRSPASRTPVDSGSPRPLSKVRSSFVAVNRNGQLGLSRDISAETASLGTEKNLAAKSCVSSSSSVSGEDLSGESQGCNVSVAARLSPITSTPKRDHPYDEDACPVTTSPELGCPNNAESTNVFTVPNPTNIPAQEGNAAVQNNSTSTLRPKSLNVEPSKAPSPSSTSQTSREQNSIKSSTKSTKSTQVDDKSTSDISHSADRKLAATVTKSKPTLGSTTSSQRRNPQTRGGADRNNVRSRLASKSPTKSLPMLPTVVTSTPATTGAQVDATSYRPSRQRPPSQRPAATERSLSRSSVSTRGAVRRTAQPSSSLTSHSRPSIGPPPKKPEEHTKATRDSHVDQDFLARMMRPTQSSSSKTTEKAPVTPPRKPPVRRSSSALAQVKTKPGTKATSPPSTKVSVLARVYPSNNSMTTASSTSIASKSEACSKEAPHPHHSSDDLRSDDQDLMKNIVVTDDGHPMNTSTSSEAADSLDTRSFVGSLIEPPKVDSIEEHRIHTSRRSPSSPDTTGLSEVGADVYSTRG